MVPDPSRVPPRTVDEVLALLPDHEALTAVVTECIDQRGTLVPDLPSEIDRDAGLRDLVQGMFDGMRDGAAFAQPDSAAIAEPEGAVSGASRERRRTEPWLAASTPPTL